MCPDKKTKLSQRYSSILRESVTPSAEQAAAPEKASCERYRSASTMNSMRVFHDWLEGRRGEQGKLPQVGYFCNIVPDEIITACGANPVRLCSIERSAALEGEKLLTADVCALLRASACAVSSFPEGNLDLLIVPAACDGKMKLAELLSSCVEVYFLDIPRSSDYMSNADIWEERYLELFDILRKRYRQKAARKELVAACREANRRTDTFREIFSFRREKPGIISAYDYFSMTSASFSMPAGQWASETEKVLKEAKEQAGSTDEKIKKKKVLLAGSPIILPSDNILDVLAGTDCDIVADTLCSAYGRLYDPVQIDEDTERGIMRSLALKHIAASMCPCFLGVEKLLDRICEMVEEGRLDGVIYQSLRLCQGFQMLSNLIRNVMKERSIPALCIQVDPCVDDRAQQRTRIEAFLELL
jgi:benzoyl-CoA reductase/2-hydroxyglutaryl-CoA dehydratase subunit BcrC/BadD/HgdB